MRMKSPTDTSIPKGTPEEREKVRRAFLKEREAQVVMFAASAVTVATVNGGAAIHAFHSVASMFPKRWLIF